MNNVSSISNIESKKMIGDFQNSRKNLKIPKPRRLLIKFAKGFWKSPIFSKSSENCICRCLEHTKPVLNPPHKKKRWGSAQFSSSG